MPCFKKILVGYDGSKGGQAALERAAALAREGYNAQLTALWVRQPLPRHADLPGEPEGEAGGGAGLFRGAEEEVAEVAKRIGVSIGCESRGGTRGEGDGEFCQRGRTTT